MILCDLMINMVVNELHLLVCYLRKAAQSRGFSFLGKVVASLLALMPWANWVMLSTIDPV